MSGGNGKKRKQQKMHPERKTTVHMNSEKCLHNTRAVVTLEDQSHKCTSECTINIFVNVCRSTRIKLSEHTLDHIFLASKWRSKRQLCIPRINWLPINHNRSICRPLSRTMYLVLPLGYYNGTKRFAAPYPQTFPHFVDMYGPIQQYNHTREVLTLTAWKPDSWGGHV